MQRQYLTPSETADRLNVSSGTLANWRSRGTGPAYLKIGRKVSYAIVDLDAWADKNKIKTIDSIEREEEEK